MNLQVLRLVALLGLLAFGAALANSQTVAELAKQSESQQRQAIMGSVDNAIKNLMSKTDRGGKPKSAQEIEESRAMANMIQALFTPDTKHPDEESPGAKTILLRIKKGAAENPNQTLADEMTGLVDPAFDHFYTSFLNADSKAIWATKSDADQVKLFRLSIELDQEKRRNQQIIKALEDEDTKVVKKIAEMDENTVVLPDGRSIFQDKDGDLVDSNGTKLQGKERELAERLDDCKARRGIKNGREALAACRDEVGIPSDSSTSPAPSATPAATPPPPTAPSPPPASPPADDPIGTGGFITPPTSFNALLCVSADLANNRSWSKPEAGSKMDTFKYRVASYIKSVAKPGWEYWIGQGQYERFNPATTSSGGQFVSAVSPDSGRFDEFDPHCPSGYAAFWVQVRH
ncbi:MAG: hypothetical protein ABI383_00250 [Acidobacteriaceae bacterium]